MYTLLVKYVAFLRGINVGGNKKVPMADLRTLLIKEGFSDVKTLLASGNVVFEGSGTEVALEKKLSQIIEQKFKFSVPVLVRTFAAIEKLIASDPFKKIHVTKDIRLYVTFLSGKPKGSIKIPYVSPKKEFTILSAAKDEVCSVLNVSKMGSVDAMSILEKEYGKGITTRNWNTLQKIAAF